MPSAGQSRARGPLPAHVYRRRRLAVLTVAVLLVLGIGRVLSWSSDGSGGDRDQAAQAGAATSTDAAAAPSATPTKKPKDDKDCTGKNRFRGGDKAKGKRKACQDSGSGQASTQVPTPTPPAEPSGPCPDNDVLVTPTVPTPVAGRDVTILLNLQMGTTQACTWRVSADSVTLKIYDGPDDVWSSLECPGAIPRQDVVIRREVPTPVAVVWDSKRSDEDCTGRTAWALPGTYNIAAAALEGEPTDVAFELTAPAAPVVTQTVQPEGAETARNERSRRD